MQMAKTKKAENTFCETKFIIVMLNLKSGRKGKICVVRSLTVDCVRLKVIPSGNMSEKNNYV